MTDQSLGVAIIGCGLIGQKRAQALGPARLVACADVALERAQKLAQPTGAAATGAVVALPLIIIVTRGFPGTVIAASNSSLAGAAARA